MKRKLSENLPKRQGVEENSVYRETHQDICSVCFGIYKDDMDSETRCIIPDKDWIQCSDTDCGAWSHVKYLEEGHDSFICSVCQCVSL